ncbi:MAG: pirin family protein [Candidatus Eremiobacteraeota bacterium]|nr:pirin family protein [Candidatus Eremiobacteraeota bacterium]MBC5826946.1 pirin family protein [Candidatus Eremiobacteraeota bacterium]
MATKPSLVRLQRAGDRYFGEHGWLRTYHSFSFADYYDPANVGWGALRVFNDDRVAPRRGFATHSHRDMEIITYVLEGNLKHEDSMGSAGMVGPGGVQYMSAGTGVAHSEFNGSPERWLHFIQMWVLPARPGVEPAYGQLDFSVQDRLDKWLTIAAGPASGAPITLSQDATFKVNRLESERVSHRFDEGRLGFVFAADGNVTVGEERLSAGDSLRVSGPKTLELTGHGEILLWDIPPAGATDR